MEAKARNQGYGGGGDDGGGWGGGGGDGAAGPGSTGPVSVSFGRPGSRGDGIGCRVSFSSASDAPLAQHLGASAPAAADMRAMADDFAAEEAQRRSQRAAVTAMQAVTRGGLDRQRVNSREGRDPVRQDTRSLDERIDQRRDATDIRAYM
jgi:hypothetical protein